MSVVYALTNKNNEKKKKSMYYIYKVDNENEEEYVPGDVKVRLTGRNYLTLG